MNAGYKFRIYPNKQQRELIDKTISCSRYVWNYFLDFRIELYRFLGKGMNYEGMDRLLTDLKKEHSWLTEVDSRALKNELKDLQSAYNNFFAGRANFPKFKSRKSQFQDYRSQNVIDRKHNRSSIRITDKRHIVIPKLHTVKCRIHRQVKGKILSAKISKTPSKQYFVSLNVENFIPQQLSETQNSVGIDLGIRRAITLSDNKKFDNTKQYQKQAKKLKLLHKRLSRKPSGSRNREKSRLRLAKLYQKVSHCKQDEIHKQTRYIVDNYGIICVEDLDVMSMKKDKGIARLLNNVNLGEYLRCLAYKCKWYGRYFVKIDRYFPSSKMCSHCGKINDKLKLSQKRWKCLHCLSEHDRDENASINIKNEGLRIHHNNIGKNTAGTAGINACEDSVNASLLARVDEAGNIEAICFS